MALRMRDVAEDEQNKLRQLVRATAPQAAAQARVGEETARRWVKRHNAAGLGDALRSGHPPVYVAGGQSRVVAKARSLPPKPAGGEVPLAAPSLQRFIDSEDERPDQRVWLRTLWYRWNCAIYARPLTPNTAIPARREGARSVPANSTWTCANIRCENRVADGITASTIAGGRLLPPEGARAA